ncbi:MAG: ABC transporter ATP-binding protein, partial [Bdellovibrionota bacterium]
LGTFVAFQRYIQKMVSPMASLGMAVNFFQRATTSTQRLKNIFSIGTDVPESNHPVLPEKFSARGGRTIGRVEFKNLSFRFPGAEKIVLSNISLTIEPGERVAFMGAIGGGKSALLSLLPRLYPVEREMLFIDGIDVNDWPIGELRKQVGYVSQDVLLFSETVTENVALGLVGWTAERDQIELIEQATRGAAVHEDVLSLASSYQTRIGERGVNLSGGQKQRLTIARALAKEPPILVLDDALSSVDVQTEEKILQGLRSRPGRNTEIIAAHRISTIKDADRIIVLEGGVIRQSGSHQELLKDRRGAYVRYYTQQQLKEELDQYSESLDSERLSPMGPA